MTPTHAQESFRIQKIVAFFFYTFCIFFFFFNSYTHKHIPTGLLLLLWLHIIHPEHFLVTAFICFWLFWGGTSVLSDDGTPSYMYVHVEV